VLTLRNGYQPLCAFYHSTWLCQHQIHLKYILNSVIGCCQGQPIMQSKPMCGGMSGSIGKWRAGFFPNPGKDNTFIL
jgi:hypothetical protein